MEESMITFIDEDGNEENYYVIEETKLNDISYLLVTDTDDEEAEEAEGFILKDVSSPDDEEAVYEFVEDETELAAVAGIFSELLEDELGIEI